MTQAYRFNEIEKMDRRLRVIEKNLGPNRFRSANTGGVVGTGSTVPISTRPVMRVDVLANRGAAKDWIGTIFYEDRSASNTGPRLYIPVQISATAWDWLDFGGYDGTWTEDTSK